MFCRICHYVALSWNTDLFLAIVCLYIANPRITGRKYVEVFLFLSWTISFTLWNAIVPLFFEEKKERKKRLTPNHKFGNGGILSIGHAPPWFKVWASRSKRFPWFFSLCLTQNTIYVLYFEMLQLRYVLQFSLPYQRLPIKIFMIRPILILSLTTICQLPELAIFEELYYYFLKS